MARRRRGGEDALNPWPGYVDALSTLLMVIIFVLLVFVLAQAFLSVALTGRDRALDRLNRQVAELTDMLSLEHGRTGELQLSVASLNRDLTTTTQAREALTRELGGLREEQGRVAADRDALRAERDRLSARLADAALQSQSAVTRNEQLQARVAETAGRTDQAGQEAADLASSLAESRRAQAARAAQLAAAQSQLEEAKSRIAEARAELDRTVQADRATIEARLGDVARLNDQLRALTALRDELERQAQDAAVRATSEEQRRRATVAQLADEQKLSESARAQVVLLSTQVAQMRDQLAQVSAALGLAEQGGRDKDAQIANLGSRLNTALASKVEELQRYRSEFFGRLRDVLANRPGIQVVGDRFVFQSEVLFPAGSADLTQAGQDEIRQLATTLKAIAQQIPSDLPWLLRVDGHADRQPTRGVFSSNWELSAERAIVVVKLLVEEGVPANRLAATGFGEFQPLDRAETPAAFAKNRRIEIRLTDR